MQERFFKKLFDIYNKTVKHKKFINIIFFVLSIILMFVWVFTIGLDNVDIISKNSNDAISGTVTEIVDKTQINDLVERQNIIIENNGEEIKAVNDIEEGKSKELKIGNKVILKEDNDIYFVTGFERTNSIVLFILVLFAFFLIVAGIKGLGALLSLTFTVVVIFTFIIPEILNGADPYVLILYTSLFLSVFNIFISHGVRSKSFLGSIGVVITLIACALFTPIVTSISSLFGFASSNEILLTSYNGRTLDLLAIFQGTILIGVLGVLDDVATAQIVTIEELSSVNEGLNFKELFMHGMIVGKEHIISMVNTLALAFISVSLPLLLTLIISGDQSWLEIVNSDIISEELIRTFISSMALIAAVPICSTLASVYYFYHNKYKKI